MADPNFFRPAAELTLGELADATGASLDEGEAGRVMRGVAPLDEAERHHVSFFDNPRYLDPFRATRAGACFVGRRSAASTPEGVVALVAADPYRAFAIAASLFHPDAMRPHGAFGPDGKGVFGHVDATAMLEAGVSVEPGAVIGPRARIGSGTVIGANAVIGHDVAIGRDCAIGPGASILHAFLGNRVIVHPGVRIGQDGFGFAMGPKGHAKVPQIGRVIVQDDVEIGAGTTIDRGALRDTVIGEGTKIDNQVQIGHNVTIGRHCVIVSQVGISGSARIGDFVAIGGQTGVIGHVTIGDGAQIATISAVNGDVPAGARYGGVPARPVRQWLREVTALRRMAERYTSERGADADTDENKGGE